MLSSASAPHPTLPHKGGGGIVAVQSGFVADASLCDSPPPCPPPQGGRGFFCRCAWGDCHLPTFSGSCASGDCHLHFRGGRSCFILWSEHFQGLRDASATEAATENEEAIIEPWTHALPRHGHTQRIDHVAHLPVGPGGEVVDGLFQS